MLFSGQPNHESQVDQDKGKMIEEKSSKNYEVESKAEDKDRWSIFVDGSSTQEG